MIVGKIRETVLSTVLYAVTVLISAFPGADALCQEPDPIQIEIEKIYDGQIGGQVQVAVSIDNPEVTRAIRQIDMLIEYPPDSVTLVATTQGQLFVDCAWASLDLEVIDTRFIHLTLIADVEDDGQEPTCYLEGMQGELARLIFTVAVDPSLDCVFLPLKFYWMECDDNHILLRYDNTYYVSREVGNHEGWPIPDVDTLPNYCGVPDSCLGVLPGGSPERLVDFWGGGVDILCADSIDLRGDINLNNIANEIADLVLFANYFLYGLEVFIINLDAQIAATDVNNDGEVLTYEDFVYLYRIIVGDALPYPKGGASGEFLMAAFEHDLIDNTVDIHFDDGGLAGAWLIFDDSVSATCAFPGSIYTCGGHYNGDVTNFLILTDIDNDIYSGPLLNLEGPGVLVEAHTADFGDRDITAVVSVFSGDLGISFVVGLIGYVFSNKPLPEPTELADADCNGYVDIDDIVWAMAHIFMGGPAPGDC